MTRERITGALQKAPLGYAQLRMILDSANRPVDAVFCEVNSAFQRIVGLQTEQILQRRISDVLSEIGGKALNWSDFCSAVALQKKEKEFEYFSRKLNRSYRVYACLDRKYFFSLFFYDITELKDAQRELGASVELFRAAFEDHQAVKILLDAQSGRIIRVNQAAVKFYGYSKTELEQMTIFQINILPAEKIREEMDNALRTKKNYFEFQHRLKSGEVRAVEVYSSPIVFRGKKLLHSIIHDVTAKKLAEERIRQSEKKFRVIFDSSYDAIFLLKGWEFVDCNQQSMELFGCERDELVGRTPFFFSPPKQPDGQRSEEKAKEMIAAALQNEIQKFEWLHQKKDGTQFMTEVTLKKIEIEAEPYLLAIVSDISRKIKLQETLSQTQKLEALGTLAGGIAHDFNNLLMGIFGFIELAMQKDELSEVKKLISRSQSALERAKSLTQQLLTFARGGEPQIRCQQLVPFIQETVNFALSGTRVLAIFEIDRQLWPVAFDRGQIARVIGNIIINAVQAMPAGGKITVSAENIQLLPGNLHNLPPGRYVKVAIRDQGEGIPAKNIGKIFDPFFSTRESGRGLGLAVCYSIVKKHRGTIFAESIEGQSTTIAFLLPAGKEMTKVKEQINHYGFQLPEGKILVLEDEPLVQEIIREMLSFFKIEAVCFTDGQSAVNAFLDNREKGEQPFLALIFDLTLPGVMGGLDAIKLIRQVDSQIVAFVSSGYSEDPVMAEPQKYGFNASISKPFRIEELKKILFEYLVAR